MIKLPVFKIFSSIVFFLILFNDSYSQNAIADTNSYTVNLESALKIYHDALAPEAGLYNGSEYAYNAYYPFVINQGDPFFLSKDFYTGSVFYNNVLYENVPLLFDIIKEELLTRDPGKIYIMRLNSDNVKQFSMWGQTFVRLKQDSGVNSLIHTGFYDELYKGNTSLYKKVQKIFKENSASSQGLNKYVMEKDEYFIKEENQYYKVKNKKSLLLVLSNKKKEVNQFIKKNRLNLRKKKDDSFTKIVAFYDSINNTKTIN